jgi:ElaB/YqjD/DUF883 family membrane-anchored ribosome-binding protein/uncharacterized protein YjbJ (UPF0337 family)
MAQGTDLDLNNPSSSEDAEISKIREQIGDTRSQMSETIDELQERLSVPALTAQIGREVSEQITSAVETTTEVLYDTAIKKVNKIMNKLSTLGTAAGGVLPLLLIGTGAGLIVMNRSRKAPSPSRKIQNRTAAKKGSTENGSTANSTLEGVREAASSAYHRVEEAVSSTASKVSDMAASGKERYVNYFDRNPIAIGAVAAAMGLAVGLALPLTETESELLGETAGTLRDQLEDAAKGTVEKIQGSAEEFLANAGNMVGESADKRS